MSELDEKYEGSHRRKLRGFDEKLDRIYNETIAKISQSAASASMPAGGFSLRKLPFLNARVNDVIAELRTKVEIVLVNGINDAWKLSNDKNNAIVDKRITGRVKELPSSAVFYDPNAQALQAFKTRQIKGLGLSDRVWNSVKTYQNELEAGLALGISKGQPAQDMARELKRYLKDPDRLFRRVKDENGVLQLSRSALDYHPGQGVYRSSYKNALRLTRTESNMSYRNSDHYRWRNMPFVVGQEIKLSNAHPEFDICDTCAGRYPKNFVFHGWHPQCICYKVPIMMSDQEYDKYEDALLEGKNPRVRSANAVSDVPEGFKNYVESHRSQIAGWKSRPLWVQDNFKNGNINKDLSIKTKPVRQPVEGGYSLTPDSITKLKEMGVTIENQAVAVTSFNNHMKGFDLEELFSDFNNMAKEFEIDWTVKKIQGMAEKSKGILVTRHIGKHKSGEITITRQFQVVDGKTEVYHAYFEIPKGLQGGGLSKQVLGSYYKQYKQAAITKVKVTANIDVGGYTWARYGFSSTNKYQILREIAERRYQVTPKQYNRAVAMVNKHFTDNPDLPFPMRRIADLGRRGDSHYGKTLLLGSYWAGELDLANRKLRRIFEDYIYGKKK